MATKVKNDALGDRMKKYEAVTRFTLPRRSFTIIRIDGRAFHTFTKKLTRPYDLKFMNIMDETAVKLCEQIAGAKFAYVQSDEISILVTDFANVDTQPWFDNVVQKWTSITASIATAAFNHAISKQMACLTPTATFDSRVFQVPDFMEVENYFVWRQKDAIRNSVTMLAQSKASHKQLHGKKQSEQHEIIHAAGDNWAKHPSNFKNGRVIIKTDPEECRVSNRVVDDDTPVFTKNREYLRNLVPLPWENDAIIRKAATGE